MVPSLILEKDEEKNYGAIFLGGFKAAINPEFLKKENVTHILNVAGKGLGILFGPKYRVSSASLEKTIKENLLNAGWCYRQLQCTAGVIGIHSTLTFDSKIFLLEFRNCYDHLSKSTPFQTTFLFNTYCMAIKSFLMT